NGYLGYGGESGTQADVVVINQGIVQADISGRMITLGGVVRGGTYHSSNGGKVNLAGTLVAGTIAADGILMAGNASVLDGATINGALAIASASLTVRDG